MFFLFFFIPNVVSIFITIDVGSYFTKSVVSTNILPKISNNSDFKTLTQSFVSLDLPKNSSLTSKEPLTDYEIKKSTPFIGSRAFYQMNSNPKVGTGFFPLFFDKKKEEKERISKYFALNDSLPRLSHTDSLSLFLSMYISSISNSAGEKTISFVVPRTFTPQQEYYLENAIKQTKYKYMQAINDDDAAMMYYFTQKRDEIFQKKKKTVLFIDVGATSLKAYAATFDMQNKKRECDVIKHSYIYSSKDGGAYITKRMSDFVMESNKFENPHDSTKWIIFERCENIKFLFENRTDDDGPVSLTQPQLEKHQTFMIHLDQNTINSIFMPIIEEIKNVITKAIGDIHIDEVQLIGKSLHIPYIRNAIKDIVGENISIRTDLSEDQTLVLGGHYYLMQSLGFKLMDRVNFINKKPLFVSSLQYNSSNTDSNDDVVTDESPSVNEISLCNADDICLQSVELPPSTTQFSMSFEGNEYMETLHTTKFMYGINDTNESREHSDFPIFLSFNKNLRHFFHGMRCNDALKEECYPINIIYNSHENYSDQGSSTYHNIFHLDSSKKLTQFIINKFDSIIDNVLNDLEKDPTINYYLSDKSRFELRKYAESCSSWLWDKADTTSNCSIFVSKYSDFSALMNPLYARVLCNKTLHNLIPILENITEKAQNKINGEYKTKRQHDQKLLIKSLKNYIGISTTFLREYYNILSTTKMFSYNENEIIKHIMHINNLMMMIERYPVYSSNSFSSSILSLFETNENQQPSTTSKTYNQSKLYHITIYE